MYKVKSKILKRNYKNKILSPEYLSDLNGYIFYY